MLVSDLYCPSCRNAKDHKPQYNEVCWSCVAMGGAGNYKESKTHGDQLRAMTDEELANTMHSTGECPPCECPYAYADLSESGGNITDKQCVECWLDWLKQEAT